MKNRPYSKLLFWILPFIFCILLINFYSPSKDKAPTGFSSTIVAFEFSNSIEKLKMTLNPLSQAEIDNLDRLNTVDFALMVCYGSFLVFFFLLSMQITNIRGLKYFSIAPVLAVVFDILENLQMFELTRIYKEDPNLGIQVSDLLSQMHLYTQFKWGLLVLCLLAIAYIVWNNRSMARYLALVMVLPAFLLCYYFLDGTNSSIDMYTNSVMFAIGVCVVYAGIFKSELGMS